MLRITDFDGHKLKAKLNAKNVRKRYHNKHKRGSGNFGYDIYLANSSYDMAGEYNADKVVYGLSIRPYYGTSDSDAQREIPLIRKALQEIILEKSNGDYE